MRISKLTIQNFKAIQYLKMEEVENALILIGKNNTGKTTILDAILVLLGVQPITEKCFHNTSKKIQMDAELEFEEEDMELFHENGIVSKYRNFDAWKKDFMHKLPTYKEETGTVSFTMYASKDGKVVYTDGIKKNNPHLKSIFPKVYYIDSSRQVSQMEDLLLVNGNQDIVRLRANHCMFDVTKTCNHCFQCIGLINQKTPEELSVSESTRLLEYKLYQYNLEEFLEKLNKSFHQNGAPSQNIDYRMRFRAENAIEFETIVENKDRKTEENMEQMGHGTKSMYILSVLEAYVDSMAKMPSILMVEDPEMYLHPQLQKKAGELLYRLSKKNQVIFSTHSPNLIFNFTSKQIKQVVLDENYYTTVRENVNVDEILDDLGYTANDLMNVSFVFIVEGKQDSSRLPLLLEKYYSEIYDEHGKMQRISIIQTNSCTNIKAYANLKYINKLYLKDQFLMIRDSDGKNPKHLVKQLCNFYKERAKEELEEGTVPRVQPKNVLVLKYYSFENYFLDPKIMVKIGVLKSEEEFYNILYGKYTSYLYKLSSVKRMIRITGIRIRSKQDLKQNMETIKIFVRGHNLFDIFYGKYKREDETRILKAYIDAAPRENFADILKAIDSFVYFDSRKKEEEQTHETDRS